MRARKQQRGQAIAEFAVAAPVILALIAMIFLSLMYLWRTANADWGLFAAGVATGSYDAPRGSQVLQSVWEDLRPALSWEIRGERVFTEISFSRKVAGMQGVALMEMHRGQVYFRLWRFYPGPRGRSP